MIVVVAGAGASRALGPEYPTTAEFWERLPPDIKPHGLLQAIESYVRDVLKRQPDIEYILGCLRDLRDDAVDLKESRAISKTWLGGAPWGGASFPGNEQATTFLNVLRDYGRNADRFIAAVEELRTRICRRLWSSYATRPSAEALDET